MKTKFLFAALLLSASAYAQTVPAPATPPASTTAPPQPATPAPINPAKTPQNTERGTIDQGAQAAAATQERVRKRQTVMDGQASPGIETTTDRRTKRMNNKKRPTRELPPTR
ncbi:hypothetical protein GCM10011375_27270 [Hymenobacter qilianensis]|uniref:Uncharacterized protein n=2 Tax=Hymenobacter qilianensis TaxID=1385715 RepID=A0ACB5PTN9_9BACT|nr:hypothetical protein [Hymenobacter qilianensis]QNP52790.1 hypothetical protein H9L05_03360 [Hymenobacter qilianensis]GGF70732.1 hypothetical protein GCM10011375_27270 [Hymenobacter qilianensis]